MGRKTGVILSYVLMVFEVLSTLLITPFIIKSINTSEYGIYKLSSAIVSYLLLLDLGVGTSVIKYAAQYRAQKDQEKSRQFVGITTIFYILIGVIVFIFGIVLVFIFPTVFAKGLSASEIDIGQKLLFITMINCAITLATTGYTNILIAYEKFIISRCSSIVSIILRMILTVIALKMGMNSIAIVTIQLFLTILIRGFFVLYVLFRLKIKPKLKGANLGFIKEIVIFSSFILLQMIATQINSSVDQILIGSLVVNSSIILGIYGIGTQIIQYFKSIGSAFTGVLMPGIVRLVNNDAAPKQICNEMVKIGRIILIVLSIIFVCFLLFGRQFISLWVGPENNEAFIVAVLIMAVEMLVLSQSVGSQVLWAKNQHKEQAILKLIIVLVNVVLTIFLIQWKPLMGATLGTVISLFVGDVVAMNIIFKKKLKISLKSYYIGLFKGILPTMLISLGAGYLFKLIGLTGWLGFIANVCMVVWVYFLCMFIFGFTNYERNLIKQIFNKLCRLKTKKGEL